MAADVKRLRVTYGRFHSSTTMYLAYRLIFPCRLGTSVYVHYRGKYRHYIGSRHYSASYCHHWLVVHVYAKRLRRGNRHYSTGTIEGPLYCILLPLFRGALCWTVGCRPTCKPAHVFCLLRDQTEHRTEIRGHHIRGRSRAWTASVGNAT